MVEGTGLENLCRPSCHTLPAHLTPEMLVFFTATPQHTPSPRTKVGTMWAMKTNF